MPNKTATVQWKQTQNTVKGLERNWIPPGATIRPNGLKQKNQNYQTYQT